MIRTLVVALAVLSSAASTATAALGPVAPFEYRFQVTSIELKATFTKGTATATTEIHLSSLPKPKSIDWYGRRSPFGSNGVASTLLHLTGHRHLQRARPGGV